MRAYKGILAGALAVGVSVSPPPALAETNGWYVGADLGYSYAAKQKDSLSFYDQQVFPYDLETKFKPGAAILGHVGYGWGSFRVEGELGYRYSKADTGKISHSYGSGKYDSSGSIRATTLMLNALYDFDTGTPWTPYIGAGVGGAWLEASSINAGMVTSGSLAKIDDSDLVFAWQGIVGVSYAFTNALSIKADYRTLGTTSAEYKIKNPVSFDKFEDSYAAHSLLVGFTYKFNAPADPAPAAKPAPAQQAVIAKSYLVFFDFDKADITPEARSIIGQAANAAKAEKATAINLVGHTDATGSVTYNLALSLRRANAVKDALITLGVPANEISVVGKGKSDPLVPTADGVREPQNRRVQILL
ncbi:membrane protein [Alphaproteobacteria bacterium]|nr:membrane protein [Alphaproteobacteria bacterium]